MTDDPHLATGWYQIVADDGVVRTAFLDAATGDWKVEENRAHLWNGSLIVVSGPFEKPPWALSPVRRRR